MNFIDPKEQIKKDRETINQIKQIIQRESKGLSANEKKVLVEAGNLLIKGLCGDWDALKKILTLTEE